jgi:hypothetical protein
MVVLIVVVYVPVLDVVKVWYYKVVRKERAAGATPPSPTKPSSSL